MDLLSTCVLVVLGNVLDFRTYRAPTQEVNQKANDHQQILIDSDINTIPVGERFAMCYSRGVALCLMDWIRRFCVITGPKGVMKDLPSFFFVQIAKTMMQYKTDAEALDLELQANCTLEMLVKQIRNVVEVDHKISSLWTEHLSIPSRSLALRDQHEYSVKWLDHSDLGQDKEGMVLLYISIHIYH